ncbi:hypothetical protein SPRG_00932 [Saprolegnia parasitica CBS 223.65]|uniref:Multidrug resistance-associated protein 1 n=1 Tax=Saprolegnia parasitica (strain CBS 223.65) TaxID=695850 RepID=A0A067D788_SAPPC|nr:hypothetical protein SPRG_00932 [Saprolegnia parasitica CBS 223.65]KDO34872.1 hypothetical protein SPRG_00932 [Saprolegnia parasitica CBS 223.65]|eukprot:XP_012194534.1 hypothetical protein SPRG_00932 [Saprolegnia parasitica CBS 223.65]
MSLLAGGQPSGYSTFAPSPPSAGPRPRASWLSRLFLAWCAPLLSLGNEKQLDLDDTWVLDEEDSCSAAVAQLEHHWARSGSLVAAFVRCYGGVYGCVGLVLAVAYGCDLAGPLILNKVVTLVSTPESDATLIWKWLGVLFGSRVLKAVLFAHVYATTQVIAMRFTSALKSVLFQKALRLSTESRATRSTGDLVNLYTTDVSNLLLAAYYVHELWILPIEIGAALYCLHDILGAATWAGVSVILLVLCLNQVLAKVMATAFEGIMRLKDERMASVHEAFGAIQTVKLHAWEDKVAAKIHDIRERELAFIWRYLLVGAFNIFTLWGAPMAVSTATFAVYALYLQQTLSAASVFTALALFRLMQEPLRSFPKIVTGMIQAHVSLQRLMTYYALPERLPEAMATTPVSPDVAIAVCDATLAWIRAGDALFHSLSLEIKEGDLVVLHGRVGSGKSSLLAALLGDMERRAGSVFLGGSVAYCSQTPWIQHMSIRDNICFGSHYEKKKYLKVLEACGLIADLQALPGGDKTEIGAKGLNLSGGQKARIALARACYSDADIFLLDAPFAAVDAIVAAEIFQKCILGLLRHKTRLLVTYNTEIIASNIVDSVLKLCDGQLVQTRTIDKAPLGPPPVSPLLGVRVGYRRTASEKLRATPSISPSPAFASVQQLVEDGFAPLVARASSFARESGQLVRDEERHNGRVSRHVFLSYFRAMGGVSVCVFLVVVQCVWQGLMQGSDFFLASWTAQDDAAQEENATSNVVLYACLALGSSALVLVRTLTVSIGGLHAARHLCAGMTTSLLRAPMSFFDATPVGRILNRFSDDVSRVDFQLPFAFGSLLATGFSVLCTLITASIVAKYVGLAILPLLLLYVRLGLYYLQPARELQRLQKVTQSPVLAHLAEANDGCAVIRAFHVADRFTHENAANIDANNRVVYASIITNQWFALRMQLLGALVVVLLTTGLTLLKDTLSPGVIGLAFNYSLAVDAGLEGLLQVWSWLETSMVSPERLQEYMDVLPETTSDAALVVPEPSWPRFGEVAFENVSLRYTPSSANVLCDVSFRIKAGEKIGVVGRTGAGKSSVASALFRLYPLASGRILLDGVDTSTVDMRLLRSRLSIITQSPILFKGTLRGYLDPFGDCSDDDLWRALEKVELRPLVAALDATLDAALEENGENLSVGERQMLCMARALLSDAQVVVMDEATAAVDAETDAKLQRVLRSEFKEATVLTIAHRLDTVLDANRIMVLDAGRVVQFGSPMSLIARGEGHFYHLVKEGGYIDRVGS